MQPLHDFFTNVWEKAKSTVYEKPSKLDRANAIFQATMEAVKSKPDLHDKQVQFEKAIQQLSDMNQENPDKGVTNLITVLTLASERVAASAQNVILLKPVVSQPVPMPVWVGNVGERAKAIYDMGMQAGDLAKNINEKINHYQRAYDELDQLSPNQRVPEVLGYQNKLLKLIKSYEAQSLSPVISTSTSPAVTPISSPSPALSEPSLTTAVTVGPPKTEEAVLAAAPEAPPMEAPPEAPPVEVTPTLKVPDNFAPKMRKELGKQLQGKIEKLLSSVKQLRFDQEKPKETGNKEVDDKALHEYEEKKLISLPLPVRRALFARTLVEVALRNKPDNVENFPDKDWQEAISKSLNGSDILKSEYGWTDETGNLSQFLNSFVQDGSIHTYIFKPLELPEKRPGLVAPLKKHGGPVPQLPVSEKPVDAKKEFLEALTKKTTERQARSRGQRLEIKEATEIKLSEKAENYVKLWKKPEEHLQPGYKIQEYSEAQIREFTQSLLENRPDANILCALNNDPPSEALFKSLADEICRAAYTPDQRMNIYSKLLLLPKLWLLEHIPSAESELFMEALVEALKNEKDPDLAVAFKFYISRYVSGFLVPHQFRSVYQTLKTKIEELEKPRAQQQEPPAVSLNVGPSVKSAVKPRVQQLEPPAVMPNVGPSVLPAQVKPSPVQPPSNTGPSTEKK